MQKTCIVNNISRTLRQEEGTENGTGLTILPTVYVFSYTVNSDSNVIIENKK